MTDEMFWESIHSMPEEEAYHELLLRRDGIVLENAVLNSARAESRDWQEIARLGAALCENNALLTQLNSARIQINDRLQRSSWRKAVEACFGVEGVEQCKLWIEMERIAMRKNHER